MKTTLASYAAFAVIAVAMPGGCSTAAEPTPTAQRQRESRQAWINELKLSNEQRGKIEDLRQAAEAAIDEKREKIQENEARIPGLIAADKVAEATQLLKENAGLNLQISERILDLRAALHSALSPEQRTILADAIRKRTAQSEASEQDKKSESAAQREFERVFSLKVDNHRLMAFGGNNRDFAMLPPEERQLLGVHNDKLGMMIGENHPFFSYNGENKVFSLPVPPMPPNAPAPPSHFKFRFNGGDEDIDVEMEGDSQEVEEKIRQLEKKIRQIEAELKKKMKSK